MCKQEENFISDISWSYLSSYFTAKESLFRYYQNKFIARYGPEFLGNVIEIGSEPHYNYRRFFPNSANYLMSNISHDRGKVDLIVDITNMSQFEDNSQDNFVCISVLEHVRDIEKAVSEITRTLRKNGNILLTVPFAFPYHDTIDYWRPSYDIYKELFSEFHFHDLTKFGGLFSTTADILQRPRGKITRRYMVYKTLGLIVALLGKKLDQPDGFPLGYGLYASKM